MRRILALAALAAAVSCSGSQKKSDASPAAQASIDGRSGRKLLIVGINDTHGALLPAPAPHALAQVTKAEIGGADWFAGYLDAIREDAKASGNSVVVLDGGDQFQGTLISNQFQGRSVVDAYNAMGITAAAVGNHEFDFGIKALREDMARAKYPMLAANIFLKGTRTRPEWAKPSVLIEQDGIRIGIVGLSTAETALVTNPLNVADLEFAEGGPIAAREADALRANGATVVLITAHAGPLPPENEIQKIAEACKGKVDAIVSGHHHTAIKPPLIVAGIPIVQSGHKLVNFSTIELTLDASNHATAFAVNDGNYPENAAPQPILHTYKGAPATWRGRAVKPNATVAQIVAGYDAQVKQLRESRIGETAVELRKGGKDDLLANLAADALRSGAGGAIKTDFSFQNAGGLRITEIPQGPITFGQIFDLYPFDNQQVVVQLPASQIRDALEAVLHLGKGPLRASGLHYTIDWERFSSAREIKDAPVGALVTQVVEDATGQPLCETKSCTARECKWSCIEDRKFTLSVTDFLANGGDGLSMLKGAPRQIGAVLTRDIIVAYVKDHQPLTPQLLGSVTAGAAPRILQLGQPKRPQAD
jgi:5'-nucleotidase